MVDTPVGACKRFRVPELAGHGGDHRRAGVLPARGRGRACARDPAPAPPALAGYTGLMPLDRLGAACFLIVLSLAAAGQYLRGTALIAWLEGPPAMAARTP
jgi:hypothetical protein